MRCGPQFSQGGRCWHSSSPTRRRTAGVRPSSFPFPRMIRRWNYVGGIGLVNPSAPRPTPLRCFDRMSAPKRQHAGHRLEKRSVVPSQSWKNSCKENTAKICALNDAFRKSLSGGRLMMIRGVVGRPDSNAILKAWQQNTDASLTFARVLLYQHRRRLNAQHLRKPSNHVN